MYILKFAELLGLRPNCGDHVHVYNNPTILNGYIPYANIYIYIYLYNVIYINLLNCWVIYINCLSCPDNFVSRR